MADKLPAKRTSNVDLNDVMTRSRAQKLTDKIVDHLDQAWALILEAHQRKAWAALGYSSWEAYTRAEFHVGRSRAYQLLDQAKVVLALSEAAGQAVEVSEPDARALKPVLQDVAAVVAEAVAEGRATELNPVIKEQVAKARVHKSGQSVSPDLHVSPKTAPKPAQQLSLWDEREVRPFFPSRPPASREEAAAAKAHGRSAIEWGMSYRPTPGAVAATSKAEKCVHPVTRRIGDGCGACGQKVGGK